MNRRTARALIKLSEECGEIQRQASKYLLHGRHSSWEHPPGTVTEYDNAKEVENEIGDFIAVCDVLMELGIIDWNKVERRAMDKHELTRRIIGMDDDL